jgi:hypothetical protein
MLYEKFLEPHSPEVAGSYTPVTTAAIRKNPVKGEDRISDQAPPCEFLPFTQRQSPPIPFEPKYKLLSARERKQMNLRGESGSTVISNSEPQSISETPLHPMTQSARRIRDETLLPATRTWACNSPVTKFVAPSEDLKSVRRRTSDLMPTTLPWASPAPPKPMSPMITDPRRQANDLIPATMPWVTPFVTPMDKIPSIIDTQDFRRKRGITEENFPRSGSLFDSPVVTRVPKTEPSIPDLSRWKIRGITPNGNEEDFVRKLLSKHGIHVVTAKAQIDILSNTCNGCVEVLLRCADRECLRTALSEANLYLQQSVEYV